MFSGLLLYTHATVCIFIYQLNQNNWVMYHIHYALLCLFIKKKYNMCLCIHINYCLSYLPAPPNLSVSWQQKAFIFIFCLLIPAYKYTWNEITTQLKISLHKRKGFMQYFNGSVAQDSNPSIHPSICFHSSGSCSQGRSNQKCPDFSLFSVTFCSSSGTLRCFQATIFTCHV